MRNVYTKHALLIKLPSMLFYPAESAPCFLRKRCACSLHAGQRIAKDSRAKIAKDWVRMFEGCTKSQAAVCTKDSDEESSGCLQTHPQLSTP